MLFREDVRTLRTAADADRLWAMLRYRATNGRSMLREEGGISGV